MTNTIPQDDAPFPAAAPTAPTAPASPAASPRPWYRLHRRTQVVLLLVLAWMTLVNVPGEMKLQDRQVYHGWPYFYFHHEPGPRASYWSFAGLTGLADFDWAAIARNVIVAICIAGLVACACELWIRRYGRFFRFSLSSLFIGTALIAILLAIVIQDLQHCLRQQRALDSFAAYARVSVRREPRDFDWFRSLFGQHMPGRVVHLNLSARFAGPTTPPDLTALSDLRSVDLENIPLTLDCVYQLSQMRNLKRLQVQVSQIQGSRLNVLQALASVPALQLLVLRGNHFGDDDLAALASAQQLSEITVISNRITGEALQHLERLESLQFLMIEDGDLTGANFGPLFRMRSLDFINFTGCKMTPVDEQRLGQMAPHGINIGTDPLKPNKRCVWIDMDANTPP